MTATFTEQGAGTEVTMRMIVASSAQRQEFIDFGAVAGGQQTLARLADYLATS